MESKAALRDVGIPMDSPNSLLLCCTLGIPHHIPSQVRYETLLWIPKAHPISLLPLFRAGPHDPAFYVICLLAEDDVRV